jgi:hypothetical protein
MHDSLIDLLDIGKEVAIGSWPFPFSSKSGLLAQGNSSIGSSMQVVVTSTAPFLYIPSPLVTQLRNTYVYITTPISASIFGIPPTLITTPSPAPWLASTSLFDSMLRPQKRSQSTSLFRS